MAGHRPRQVNFISSKELRFQVTEILHAISRKCYALTWKGGVLYYENIADYLTNHWTKHRLVCIHFDAFSMLISNMDTTFDNSEIC